MRSGFATGIQVISNSSEDVDFYIHELYPIHFFGTTVYITTTHVCTFIVLLVIAILAICARRSVLKTRDNPSKFATGVELAIESLIKFVNSTMGKEAGKHYINYIGTLFIFVLFSNISGLFMLRPPTADYGTTLCIALVSFIMIQYASIRYQKWGAFKSLFDPIFLFFPINVISEFATPGSLSLRLFGNILAGTVMMALYYREKTGIGQHVDVAMMDVIFSILENAIVNYTVGGEIPERNGNIDPSISPFDVYNCKDGFVAIGVGNDRLFDKFCKTMNREDLLEDPRFATNDLRQTNYIPDLKGAIQDYCGKYTKKELEMIMDEAGIPCGPVMNVKEIIEHPQTQAREMMVHCEHPTAGDQYFQGCVIKLSETPGKVEFAAPLKGQHNREIFGLTEEEEKQLREEGVIA